MSNTSPPLTSLQFKRRRFLQVAGAGLAGLTCSHASPRLEWNDAKRYAAAFDPEIERFMTERQVPGGALAVVRDQSIVYARGYGLADLKRDEKVSEKSLFRIASLSKPITALAVFKLIEAGRLDPDTPAFPLLANRDVSWRLQPKDPRILQITIRQLLHHTAGWDRDAAYDPMFRSREIARSLRVNSPPTGRQIMEFMMGEPLQFDPGQRFAYSNLGYCVLGRVIEAVTGTRYERYVRSEVLKPMGVSGMRLGRSRVEHRAGGEVAYHCHAGPTESGDVEGQEVESVFGDGKRKVTWPYGGFCLESMDAHGGWLASVIDLARVQIGMVRWMERWKGDRGERTAWGLRQWIQEPPMAPVARKGDGSVEDAYYGGGWMVRPVVEGGGGGRGEGANLWHTGSLPGTWALWVRRWDGWGWVVLMNQRSEGRRAERYPDDALDGAMHRAAGRVQRGKRTLFDSRPLRGVGPTKGQVLSGELGMDTLVYNNLWKHAPTKGQATCRLWEG